MRVYNHSTAPSRWLTEREEFFAKSFDSVRLGSVRPDCVPGGARDAPARNRSVPDRHRPRQDRSDPEPAVDGAAGRGGNQTPGWTEESVNRNGEIQRRADRQSDPGPEQG